MKEAIVANAYAKSIYALGSENNVDVAGEMTKITEAINACNDLETLLFLDVFDYEEKSNVLNVVLEKLGVSSLTKNALKYLIQEKRIHLFPMIFKNIIVLDDHKKGFLRGTIEGSASEADPSVKAKLETYLKEKLGKDTQLTYVQSENVTAGYRVTVEDLQLDASLDNQLNKLKNEILNA